MKEEQPFRHPVERRLFSLLQQKQTRFSLIQIQAFMLRNALETNLILFTKFIATCASTISTPAGIRHARTVFEHRPPSHRHDTFLCNTMIEAHKDSRQFAESFCLYRDLRRYTSFLPDNFTFLSLSKSCSSNLLLWEGQQLHDHVIRNGYSLDLFVSTALVDMYAKFGDIMCAAKLFDQMTQRSQVSWTCLVCGYARSGDTANARKYFYEMPQKDLAAFNAMIDAYVKVGDMDSAQSLFDVMPERNVISWTTLISGYCINNFVDSARQLFDAMPEKNLISWNAMIGGYCQNKQPHEALKLFHELQSSTLFEPDEVTIASILPAISDLGAFDLGRWVHHYVQTKRLDKATNVCTSLIDMYAKCGEITKAMQVFDSMPRTENPPWNAMINGFAVNGRGKEALEVFQEMLNCGIQPNEITMIAVLSACNHSGLVEEGKRWLKEMDSFGLTPAIEHYGCVIDLLGRAGHLEEAEKLLNSMPYEANGIIMSSFLCACGFSKDLMKAERAIQKAIKMDPSSDGNYVLLRNLYAMERRWTDVEEIKGLMRRSGAKKEAGCSVIEENSKVLEFVSGDKMHPKWDVIGSVLKQLQIHMKGRRGDSFNL
ncbi:hypothetical protein Nepgr_024209 [Nepenthes gracilis]|uniref:Pentatricopeptide repeat-containing protein n=1 Tax=Nepenthes gracilis TaxID=150966 RepID=A0AAD3Y090_NEPGR|nr:hypothetical protein Nepgr_024209 [Nepenthes gracilis]